MHRIDNATRAVDANGAGKDGFTGGDPDLMIAPTVLPADYMNALQEELANIAEKASPLRKSNSTQLLNAINWGLSLTNAWTLEERLSAGPFVDITSDDEATVVVIGSAASPATRIWCAADGWTLAPITPTFAQALRAVAWAPGPRLFVAAGTSGCILTSPDGLTWTARTADASYAGTFFEIACSPTRIVLFGDSDEVQTSEDGITWTHRTVPSSHGVIAKSLLFSSTAWSDAAACFVATRGPALLVSADGITWTAGAAPPSATMSVTDSPCGFLAGHDATDALWLSLDGLAWVSSPVPGGFDTVYPGHGGFLLGTDTTGIASARISSGPGQRGRAFLGTLGIFLLFRLRFCWATIGAGKVYLSRPFPKLG